MQLIITYIIIDDELSKSPLALGILCTALTPKQIKNPTTYLYKEHSVSCFKCLRANYYTICTYIVYYCSKLSKARITITTDCCFHR